MLFTVLLKKKKKKKYLEYAGVMYEIVRQLRVRVLLFNVYLSLLGPKYQPYDLCIYSFISYAIVSRGW